MDIEEILADYEEGTKIPVEVLDVLYENWMISEGYNNAPDGKVLYKFIKRWPFCMAGGTHDGRRFSIEEVSGLIPDTLTTSDLKKLFSDMLVTFYAADEQEMDEEGNFRFWYD